MQYWIEKKCLTDHNKDLIDMDAMKKSHSTMSFSQKLFTAKWTCKFVATGENMQRWKQSLKGNCPYCMGEKEDTKDILTCSHADARMGWDKAIKQWVNLMLKIDMCSYFIGAV